MRFFLWLHDKTSGDRPHASAGPRRAKPRSAQRSRLQFEALENRRVLSTVTVFNTLDSGSGSLRAAIASAHRGDTIAFASSLAGQTITLTSGELFLKQDVTIAGPGTGPVTISGNNASRVFELSSKTKPQVTLSGLTISDGYAPGPFGYSTDNGGGILNEGMLTVRNCILSHNSAPIGAGILNDSGATLTIVSSALTGNSGRDERGSGMGGGIANFGTLVVHGSTFSYNSVSGTGGAIYTITGAVTIDGQSILSHNSADAGGAIGGSVGLNRALTISDSTLSDNSARSGAAITFAGTLALNRCTLEGNSAGGRGGAIYVGPGSLGSAVTISGCTVTGNSASDGGGIYSTNNSGTNSVTVTVEGTSSIVGNTASAGADVENLAVLYLDSTSTIAILDGNAAVPI
jgi:predicted outer membrane repeat protein